MSQPTASREKDAIKSQRVIGWRIKHKPDTARLYLAQHLAKKIAAH
jgi:hypothetical protein